MSSVPFHLDLLGSLLEKTPNMLKAFGNLETQLLTYDIIETKINRPVFVTSLARSGTTILLEILNAHSVTAAHQYRDYPFIHMVYFWGQLSRFFPGPKNKVERAHKDRILVNYKSPEAIDEIIWMSFFAHLHDPQISNSLDQKTSNPDFEKFYQEHIKKLLVLRRGSRFICKNNYNIARIPYLLKLFPDAKFVIPLRKAEDHIASLVKQHKLISQAQKSDRRAANYMKRHGHFEFGLDFRPLNIGNGEAIKTIMSYWEQEDYISAYIHYWAYLHDFIYETYMQDPDLLKHIHFVKYDELCLSPQKELEQLFDFCDLDGHEIIQNYADTIKAPSYYKKNFTDEELKLMKEIIEPIEQKIWNHALVDI